MTALNETLLTVRDWVRYFVSEMNRSGCFFGHGCDNAQDEAVFLVQSALALPLDDISGFLDARLTEPEKKRLARYLSLRTVDRVPAPYVTGQAWLMGQAFRVDARVIIPRSFIAELLQDQLHPWLKDPDEELRVLDLCCGSGCLGILAAMALPNSQVDCVDLSTQALDVAYENIRRHNLEERVQPVPSDLFDSLQDRKYDIILTNPPYVNSQSMRKLPAEYLHEPQMALEGGEDGMELIERILEQAHSHLNNGGMLFCELGNERAFFESRFPKVPALWLEVSAGEDQVFMLRKEDLTGC